MAPTPKRTTFNQAQAQPDGAGDEDRAPSHVCKVRSCQMTGSIDGLCCYHWMAHPSEWPAVSEALNTEIDILIEINTARRLFNDPKADYADVHTGHVKALERLAGRLTQEHIDFLKERNDQDYHRFIYSLELLIGRAVTRVTHKQRESGPRRASVQQVRTPAQLLNEMYPA